MENSESVIDRKADVEVVMKTHKRSMGPSPLKMRCSRTTLYCRRCQLGSLSTGERQELIVALYPGALTL